MQSMARSISIDVCDYTDKPLCNLYDSANQISGQAINVVTHTERNGYKELRFNIPSTCEGENGPEENYRLQYLVSDYRIKLQIKKPGQPIETDWFLISENKITHNAFSKQFEVHAKHISQLLTTKNLDLEFSNEEGNNQGTIRQLAGAILEGTGWHLGEVAEFLEEEKYSQGQQIEKKRTFTSQAKSGAFKMMNDLCELFKAKAIYHGEGTYEMTDQEITDALNADKNRMSMEYIPDDYEGNIDLTSRIIVPKQQITNKGWSFTDDYATIFSHNATLTNYDNKKCIITITPIKPNGTVLTEAQLNTYITKLTNNVYNNTFDNILYYDTNNLVLHMHVVEDGETQQHALQAEIAWVENLEDLQEEWDTVRATNGFFGEQGLDPAGIFNSLSSQWVNPYVGEKIGRTVDILPLNPFSEKVEDGDIPVEVLREKKVLELHYDKNIKDITRTLNTDSLITKLYGYGAVGDYATGYCSLMTGTHKEITFNLSLQANREYYFTYLNSKYYFTPSETITNGKWSYLDFVSRSYIYYYNGTKLKICKVYKTPNTQNPTVINSGSWTIEDIENKVPYVMDFSYYQKVGLLTDEMLYDLATSQIVLPKKYVASQKYQQDFNKAMQELLNTTSDGNGFARMSTVVTSNNRDNSVILDLNTIDYPDGVMYRSDYLSSSNSYFSWKPASGFKNNGQAINATGSVIYCVKQGSGTTATKWVKAYLRAVGRDNYFYYRDSLETIYKITSEAHYDKKKRSSSDDPSEISQFPTVGNSSILYIADKEFKNYVWNGEEYVEGFACQYVYGIDKFQAPTKIMLWTSDRSFFVSADYVYMFSSDSLAGVFGPREDEMNSNPEALLKARHLTTEMCSLDFVYADHNEVYTEPDSTIAQKNYGWYYLIYPEIGSTNRLFFCWGKADDAPDNGWKEVYISYGTENPEKNPAIPATSAAYEYYYSIRKKMLYKQNNVTEKWIPVKDTVDKNNLVAHFAAIVSGCRRQERLYKGLAEAYSHSVTTTLLQGNYALKNDFDTYWLFTTNRAISSGQIRHKADDKMIWQSDDIDDTVNCVERTFDVLTFPSANDLEGVSFSLQSFDPSTNIFSTGESNKISNNVPAYDKITYKCKLPANTYVVYLDVNGRVIDKTLFTNSTLSTAGTFNTPANTTHIRIVCPASVATFTNCKVYVEDYSHKVFSNDTMYTVLTTTASSNRDGISELMDRFVSLSNEAFFIRLPAYQRSQQQIKNITTNLMDKLGDMYREGRWQNNDYVEKDEYKLYLDALDNIHEVAHPEVTYDISYIDLYKMQHGVGLSIDESTEDIDYPDIDISYAAHLIDPDIDINCWAYIDMTEICHDKPWESKIEINTKLSMIGQQSFTDVLARMADVANTVKANETVYKRSASITGSGKMAAERLEGAIDLNRLQILGGTSNWYTDSKGNIIFESSDGESAMMLTGKGWAISQEKNKENEWVWRYIATGKGLTADAIYTGYLSGDRIEAGSITTDKISSSVGQELDIGSNTALNLFATVDGTRPAGYLVTQHPDLGSSWISIGPKTQTHEAYIDIKSGGIINIEGTSSIHVASQGSIKIDSGGEFLINSENFSIIKQSENNYSVTVKGSITAKSGNIAGFIVDSQQNQQGAYTRQWLQAGNTDSLTSLSAGVYLGTDGINLGGKMIYKINDESLAVKATSVLIGDENSTYIKLLNNSFTMNAAADITLSAVSTININAASSINITSNSSISIQSNKTLTITTAGSLSIGNGVKPFTIGATTGTDGHAYIYNGVKSYSDTDHDGIYLGTDGIVLGQGKFKVSTAGVLNCTGADVSGTITATSGKIGNWYIRDNSICNADSLASSTVGMYPSSSNNTVVFWAGNSTRSDANFRVYANGNVTLNALTATNANVKGTIKATALYLGTSETTALVDGKIDIACTNVGSQSSGVYITPTSITIGSSGSIDLTAANVSLNASQVNGAFSVPTGMLIEDNELKIYSGANNYIRLVAKGTSVSGQNGLYAKGTEINFEDSTGANYVHINDQGITMKGNKLVFIDEYDIEYPAWSRDDIVVVRKDQSSESIIAQKSSEHDWVMIKPVYDTQVVFSKPNTQVTLGAELQYVRDGAQTLADQGTGFKYEVYIKASCYSQLAVFDVGVWATNGTYTRYLDSAHFDPPQEDVSKGKVSTSTQGEKYFWRFNTSLSTGGLNASYRTTFTAKGTGAEYNLAADGYDMYVKLYWRTYSAGSADTTITQVYVTASCDSATTYVPCTVYYFP